MSENIVQTSPTTQPVRAPIVRELVPAIDIYENDKELLVVADLPRVTRDKLAVQVNHPELKIEGRVDATDRQPETVYRRTFRLDSSVDVGRINAKLSDGTLEIHLPKSEPYRVRKIDVRAG
jgi:HSP20 family protein